MDLTVILTAVSGLIVVIIVGLLFYQKRSQSKDGQNTADARGAPGPINRRAQAARNARNRMRPPQGDEEEEEEDDAGQRLKVAPEGKVGAKKLAKLQAKADRKAQREVEDRELADRRKREAVQEEERQKASEKEAAEAKKREEEERKLREEKERREHEEYLKMKAAFSVEEEGFEDGDGGENKNELQEFVSYIKEHKVVIIEDLAAEFRLKSQAVIDRLHDLQNDGILTGVIDDRGKFIYISQQELESVAKFVKQRGRISIADLAESSNELINLNFKNKVEAV